MSYNIKGCYNLSNIFEGGSDAAYKSVDGVLYTKSGTTLLLYPMGKKDTQFTVPDVVTNIGAAAFNGCLRLETVIFNGTKDQWLKISFAAGRESDDGSITVKCTDGEFKFAFH